MSGKRIFSIVLIIVMMLSTASFATIEKTENLIEPMYAIDLNVKPSLAFQGDVANCKLTLGAPSSAADRAVVRIVLEKQNGTGYTVVKTWRDQALNFDEAGVGSITRTYQVSGSGNYRIRVSGTVYKNNVAVATFTDKVSSLVMH